MITPSQFIVNRCTDYDTVEVANFQHQSDAQAAVDTLIRMTSSQRDYWYEVCEMIAIPA